MDPVIPRESGGDESLKMAEYASGSSLSDVIDDSMSGSCSPASGKATSPTAACSPCEAKAAGRGMELLQLRRKSEAQHVLVKNTFVDVVAGEAELDFGRRQSAPASRPADWSARARVADALEPTKL